MRHVSLAQTGSPGAALALAAVRAARAAETVSFGPVSVRNGDGSRTLIGPGGVVLGSTGDLKWLTASGNFSVRNLKMQLSQVQQTLADGGVVANASRMNQISTAAPPDSTAGYAEGAFWTQVESPSSLVATRIWRVEDSKWVEKDLGAATLITPTMDAGLIDAAAVAAKMIVSGEMWSSNANPRHGMTAAGFQSFDGMARETVHLDGQRNTLLGTSDFGRVVFKRFTAPEGIQIRDLGWPSWSAITARDFSGFAKNTTAHAVQSYFGVFPRSMTWATAPDSFADLDFTFDPNGDYSSVPEYVSGRWTRAQLEAYASAAIWVDDTHGTSAMFRDLNGLGYLAPESAMGVVPAAVFRDDGTVEVRQDDTTEGRKFLLRMAPTGAGVERSRLITDGGILYYSEKLGLEDGGVAVQVDGWGEVTQYVTDQNRYGFPWVRTRVEVGQDYAQMSRTSTYRSISYDNGVVSRMPADPSTERVQAPSLVRVEPGFVMAGVDARKFSSVLCSYVHASGGYVNVVGSFRTTWAGNTTFLISSVTRRMEVGITSLFSPWALPKANSTWNAIVMMSSRAAQQIRYFITERTDSSVVVKLRRDYAAQQIDVTMFALFFQNPIGG